MASAWLACLPHAPKNSIVQCFRIYGPNVLEAMEFIEDHQLNIVIVLYCSEVCMSKLTLSRMVEEVLLVQNDRGICPHGLWKGTFDKSAH
jgi:hypothetical protein